MKKNIGVHFNSVQAVSVHQLRQQVYGQLVKTHMRLDPKGAFNRQAANQNDSLLGSMFLNMMLGGTLSLALKGVFDAHAGIDTGVEGMEHVAFAGLADIATELGDEKANRHRGRKLDMYPQGRRQDPLRQIRPINKTFNLMAGNDNARAASDAYARIAALSDMLDMLDQMEKDGVSAVYIENNEAVYDVLKDIRKNRGTLGFSPRTSKLVA